MKLTGSYQINLEKQKVWEALNDPDILKKAIPGCEEFSRESDYEFKAKATNKIGPFNASFTGTIELKNIDAPNSYKIVGSGNSPVGFASGEADVKLEVKNNGTELIYSVEANVGGKIAQIGSRLIDMTAKKMADIFFTKFQEIVETENVSRDKIEKPVIENQYSKNSINFLKNKKHIYIIAGIVVIIVAYFAFY